jgi:hypothetical protein
MVRSHKYQWQRRQVLRDKRQRPESFRPELLNQDNQMYRGSNRPELLGPELLHPDNQPCQDSECRGLLYRGESANRLKTSNTAVSSATECIIALRGRNLSR